MKVRYIDWYPDEWLAGTLDLADDERGVYITMCSLIYSRGGPISMELIKRFCSSHGNALNRIIQRLHDLGKTVVNDPEIFVKRCGIELEKAQNRARKARENGGKGGRPRNAINGLAKPEAFTEEKLTRAELKNLRTNQPIDSSSYEDERSARQIAASMLEVWREVLVPPLALPRQLSAKRIAAGRARFVSLFHGSMDEWQGYLTQIRRSPFLLGDNDRGWKADFDFAVSESGALKILEGKYDSKPTNGAGEVSERRTPQTPPPEIEGWELFSERTH